MKLSGLLRKIAPTALVDAEVIHAEMYSASADLLKQQEDAVAAAQAILDKEDGELASSLSSLGFSNAKNIQHIKRAESEKANAEERMRYVKLYAQKYPLVKFVTQDAVDRICKKYNLLLCAASDFIGAIPLKNQQEIHVFRVMGEDIRVPSVSGIWWDNGSYLDSYYRELAKEKEREAKTLVKCEHLRIIAPMSEIDMRDKRVVDRRVMTKDPIVLQPVNGGYLIGCVKHRSYPCGATSD